MEAEYVIACMANIAAKLFSAHVINAVAGFTIPPLRLGPYVLLPNSQCLLIRQHAAQIVCRLRLPRTRQASHR